MLDLFDMFIKIGLVDEDVDKGLDELEKKVDKVAYNIGSVLGGAIKGIAGATAAVADGATALVTQSVAGYKEYEQLVGGVETLFSNLEGTVSAAPAVLEKANNAFKTAGMSANQYMETVTGFSASLIAGLNNDYEKAAEVADMAITDMSDNANKMGTSLESLRYAYQGFAKQNYMMLDNLKLGYGGTKTEMERLLKDAQKFSGIKYDISNLSDVYEAIHVIQEQMGITGTTAKEAEHTIEGSLNALSSAYQNLIAGFADKNANLEQLVDNLVQAMITALDNLMPAVETTFSGLVKSVDALVPIITKELPKLVNKIVPVVVDAATSIMNELAVAIPETAKVLLDVVPNIISSLIDTISNLLPQLFDLGTQMFFKLVDGIADMIPDIVPVAVDIVLQLVDSLLSNIDLLVDAAIKLITGLAEGLASSIPILLDKAPVIITKLVSALIENVPKIYTVPRDIFKAIADGLVHADWGKVADDMMTALISGLDTAIKQVAVWIDNAKSFLTGEESKYGGDIANVPTSDFVKGLNVLKDDVSTAIDDFSDEVRESYDAYYGVISDTNDKLKGAYYNIEATMSDYASSLEKQAERWKKGGSALSGAVADVELDEKEAEAKLKAHFQDLETQMYESGYNEGWLVHQERAYVEALDHNTELYKTYNLKLLKEEERITKQANSEYDKMVKAAYTEKKNAIEKAFAEIERQALENDYTEEWLVKQERAYIEALDHSSAPSGGIRSWPFRPAR